MTVTPATLGAEQSQQSNVLTAILDGYFRQGGHHLNVNVLSRELLQDAMEHPDKYPDLTIRVSGYAVHFNRLTRKQQMEVISRTCHMKLS
jgi:formate C-acetyltransferase